jgi:mannose-6-phosphate isomerase-like protein (cupin superfamily)
MGGGTCLSLRDDASVPFVDVAGLPVLAARPGDGQFRHAAHMTFAYYAIAPGAQVNSHEHEEEEVWHVLERELEVVLPEGTSVVKPGQALVVPAGEPRAVRALEPCRVIAFDHPARTVVGGVDTALQTELRASKS